MKTKRPVFPRRAAGSMRSAACLGLALTRSRACRAITLRRRVLSALLASLVFLPAGRVTAQTFTTVYDFGPPPVCIPFGCGPAGGAPSGDLILSGSILYGTAYRGDSSGVGGVFALHTDGSGFTNLHSFTGNPAANSDGAYPRAGLILLGKTLYGTAWLGGSSGNGALFAVNTDGTGFTNLHSFTGGNDGAYPVAGLILPGSTLYGTASGGSSYGNGTVFALHTD